MGPALPNALHRILDLAMRCVATFTADRPSMGRIAQEMEALRAEVGSGEEPVHKSHRKVDAELKEKMQQQKQMNEDLVTVLASIRSMGSFGDTGDMGLGSVRDTGNTSTGETFLGV
ncbi:unnamed protein product [Closterium sp. NIES-53]